MELPSPPKAAGFTFRPKSSTDVTPPLAYKLHNVSPGGGGRGTAMSDKPIRRSFDWPALIAVAVAVVALLGIAMAIHSEW